LKDARLAEVLKRAILYQPEADCRPGRKDMDVLAAGYGLIEGPVWDPVRGLYFSDVINGGVYLLDRAGKVSPVVPKRRGIGGMALHAAGGLVVGGRDIAFVRLADGHTRSLLSLDAIPGATGFNDLTTDQVGRIYVGSLAFRVFGGETPKPGYLHVIDMDGTMRTLADGIMLTNGLGFSPDGKQLYHCDARAAMVRVYDVASDGTVGRWRRFATLGDDGVPDGLKVASDGSVWVADAHGGRVVAFNRDGSHRQDLPVPLPMVTSLCFGGDDLSDLYVVTGSRGGESENCASIFRTHVDVAGLALPPARVVVA
jgi:D-xylonolactonase